MVERTPQSRRMSVPRARTALALAGALVLAGCATGATGPATRSASSQQVQAQSSLQAILRLAARTESSGNLAAARELYRKAAAKYPDAPAARLGLARITYKAGEPAPAAELYRDALGLAPQSWAARYGLGKSLLSSDRPEAALKHFDRLIARKEKDHRPYLAKGVALDLLGRHAEAQQAYNAGLEAAPRNVALRNNLGLSLALAEKHKEALRVLEETARDPKAGPRTRQNLALVYGLAGEMDEAALTARADLQPDTVERNLAYYRALRSARDTEAPAKVERETDTPASDRVAAPRKQQVAALPSEDTPAPRAQEPAAAEPAKKATTSAEDAPLSLLAAPAEENTPKAAPKTPAATAATAVKPHPEATSGSTGAAPMKVAAKPAEPKASADKPAAKEPETVQPEPAVAKAGDTLEATPAAFSPAPAAPQEIQATGRAYWVQIASFPSEQTSRGEWQRLSKLHDDLLSGLSLSLQKTELQDKGIFYRVRTGPFASAAAPKRLCEELKARDQACLVVRSETAS